MMGKRILAKYWNPILRVVTIYLLVAVLWILISDQVISWFIQDPTWLTRLQTYKGALFVIVTSVLLFFLLRREVRKLEAEVDKNIQISGELRTSNEQLSAIIDSSPLAIVSLDRQFKITLWNPAAERLFGWKTAEVIGESLPYLLEDLSAELLEMQNRVIKGETIEDFETRRKTKDGRILNVLLSTGPLHNKNGEIDQIMGILVDITARKLAEEKLLKLSNELEQRVQERTIALEETNNALTTQIEERLQIERELREQTQRLEAINQELESFSYSVSHDLRAPLRQIRGFSQLLLEESGGELSPQAQADLDRILRGAASMSELIDALLVLTRVSRGDLNEAAMDLADIARDIIQDLQHQEPHRKATFVIPEHVSIKADPRMLRIIMENLISNAWKFTSQIADARIEFGVVRPPDKMKVYFIRDNGVGFPPESAGKIFNAFQRLHNPEEYPGMGIGLATVQRIIRRYGGDIWAEGKTNLGATIFFTLGKDRED